MTYFEYFKGFIPIYKRQYFKAKLMNDMNAILDIKENIWNNWNLTLKEKKEILKEIGLTE